MSYPCCAHCTGDKNDKHVIPCTVCGLQGDDTARQAQDVAGFEQSMWPSAALSPTEPVPAPVHTEAPVRGRHHAAQQRPEPPSSVRIPLPLAYYSEDLRKSIEHDIAVQQGRAMAGRPVEAGPEGDYGLAEQIRRNAEPVITESYCVDDGYDPEADERTQQLVRPEPVLPPLADGALAEYAAEPVTEIHGIPVTPAATPEQLREAVQEMERPHAALLDLIAELKIAVAKGDALRIATIAGTEQSFIRAADDFHAQMDKIKRMS